MEETPRYWNFSDTEYRFTEKLTGLCASFRINYQQLVELMSQFEIYISGGAAVWCMGSRSSEPEYSGDIDFFINYNLDTVQNIDLINTKEMLEPIVEDSRFENWTFYYKTSC